MQPLQRHFRFGALLDFAERAGAALLWTGHYARIVERDGLRLIAQGADPQKDQSYMLATVDPHALDRVAFPLGEQDKAATRAEAVAAGLAVASRAESQEACFLAGGDYRLFLERQGSDRGRGRSSTRRDVSSAGTTGAWNFTPGQRRGLRVSTPEPLYALRVDPAANAVVVGPHASLACSRVAVRGRLHVPVERVAAKLRYRSGPVSAFVEPTSDGFVLELDEPAFAVAAGQIASHQEFWSYDDANMLKMITKCFRNSERFKEDK